MKSKILLAASTLILSACATQQTNFSKPGVSEEQFMRDRMTCRQMGMQSAQANGLAGNMFVEMWIRDETIKCLKELGYTAHVTPAK